jgi:hypothetical protein
VVVDSRLSGQVSERLKEQHWKCCMRGNLHREFESHPVRFEDRPIRGSLADLWLVILALDGLLGV